LLVVELTFYKDSLFNHLASCILHHESHLLVNKSRFMQHLFERHFLLLFSPPYI